ncbi:hypothetical protein [Pseudomonas sp. LRF_L74]|uniref:hypothetical protein n=1 Tax=Pseudomonas sp. LRF_L74 TaxID=3369422 RepID=UPI003F61D26A
MIPALLLGGLAALGIAQRPLYSVSALLEVPNISLEEWRQAQSYLWDRRWVAHSFADEDIDAERLLRAANNPVFWANTVQYRSSLNRDDIREVPLAQIEKARGLGLSLNLRAQNEEQAEHYLELLTRHIGQALLANNLLETVREGQKTLAERPQLNIQRLQTTFNIQQAEQRIADMRSVLERYPEARQMAPNTVVSVQDNGGKYLAPLPQIIALEATVSDEQAHLRKLQRGLAKLDAYAQLFSGLDEVHHAASGDEILTRLTANRDKLINSQTALTTEQDEAIQELNVKLDQAQVRQAAIGLKSRSALSLQPIPMRNPKWVGLLVFAASLLALSLWLALYVWLRGERPILTKIPDNIRRHLVNEVSP